MGQGFNWKGEIVKAKLRQAAIDGVNETMAEAALAFKQNHPGWNNRTGTAERSVQILEQAAPSGRGVAGKWGSRGTNYMMILELKRGAALRSAADSTYPSLPDAIRRNMT